MDKREADIHHQYNREKFDVIIKHLEKINGRLQKAENNITGISGAEAVGRYEAINSKELFEMEYWSLEQAKLAGIKERPLDQKIALITGGAIALEPQQQL